MATIVRAVMAWEDRGVAHTNRETDRPLTDPFRADERVPWCPNGMGDFWAVHPETRWETTRDLTVDAWLGPEHSDHLKPTLLLGTPLTLVSIHPCDDSSGMCGYWQGLQSAHAFRVDGGPFVGYVVEVWGWEQQPPPDIRLLEPGALISFAECLGFHMPQEQPGHALVGRGTDRP
jgi:hypothetical protein